MGGSSFERAFSLKSGKRIYEALEEGGYKVLALDTTKELVPTLRSERPDVAFIALHGKHGEDGTIQSLLEFVGIPYVGSNAHTCRSTWNKDSLHTTMAAYRAAQGSEAIASWPQGICIARDAFKSMGAASALDLVSERVFGGFPVAVKPTHGGSALGVHRVDCQEDLGAAILDALSYDDSVVIEQWIEGCEMAVSIMGTGEDANVVGIVEICPKSGIFDTAARMDANAVEYYAPVRDSSLGKTPEQIAHAKALIEAAALEVYRAYDMHDYGRIDLIWDGNAPRVLETATVPGMTETSLFPAAVKASGMSMAQVLDTLVQNARLTPWGTN